MHLNLKNEPETLARFVCRVACEYAMVLTHARATLLTASWVAIKLQVIGSQKHLLEELEMFPVCFLGQLADMESAAGGLTKLPCRRKEAK